MTKGTILLETVNIFGKLAILDSFIVAYLCDVHYDTHTQSNP